MKNLKRFLSFALAVLMMLSYAPTIAYATELQPEIILAESEPVVEEETPGTEPEETEEGGILLTEEEGEGLEPVLEGGGPLYEVSGGSAVLTDGKSAVGDIVIPETVIIDGTEHAVTAIADNAFNDANEVTSIVVPNSVTSLGAAAFANMDKLKSITIGNGVTSWGSKLAVNNYELETVVIAEGATIIGDLAFRTCPKLANVTLPSTLKTIGATAFTYAAIEELTIPASVESIGSDSFKDIDTLKKVTFLGENTKLGSTCFQMCDGLEEVVLPANLTTIPQGAFRYCTALKTINFPETLTEIGNYSFQGCTSLETVVISKNITNLVTNAFNGCTSLKNLTIEEGFSGTIGGYVFQGCTALESVVIPSSMETVGESMFNMCSSLKNVTLSEGVKTLNISAFANCTSLETLTLPDSLERIRHGSFANCTALRELIVLGDNLPVIEHSNALDGLSDELVVFYNGDDEFTGNWASLADNKTTIKNYVAKIGDVEYTSLQKAIDDAENNDTIVLLDDINIASCEIQTLDEKYNTLFKVEDRTVTVDLNEKTIYGNYTGDSMLVGVFSTDNNGHLTITGNGTINVTATATVYSLFANYESGCTITIENGTYTLDKASDSLLYTGGNEGIIVKGGTFTLGNIGTGQNGSPWIFNAKGQNGNRVYVIGGTFNADVFDQYWAHEVQTPNDDPSYYSGNNGDGTWTVNKGAEASLLYVHAGYNRIVGYKTIAEAVAKANAKTVKSDVTVLVDAEINEAITLNSNVKMATAEDVVVTLGKNGKIEGNFDLADGNANVTAPEGYKVVVEGEGTDEQVVYVKAYVAQVGETKYESLAEAVKAANETEGGATVELLADVTLGEKLTISGNVTISGEHTITRDDAYTGTLFTVNAGATLTLDGGLTIDGANEWAFDEEQYNTDLNNNTFVSTGFNNYVVSEPEAPIAAAVMFNVQGNVVLNKATIQNHMGNINQRLFYLNGTSSLELNNGASIIHCATAGKATVAYLDSANSVLSIKEGALIQNNYGSQHAALIRCEKGTFNMSGGEIIENYGAASNGSVLVMRSGSTFNMTGGKIAHNSSVVGNGGNNTPAIMLYNGANMNMSDGEISNNTGATTGGILAQNGANLKISGGRVVYNTALNASYADYDDIYGSNTTEITGGTFTQDVSAWCAEGFAPTDNGDGTWTVGEADPIAQVGETPYWNLKKALDACENGETVKLIADIVYDADDIVNAIGGATGFGDYPNPSIIYAGGTRDEETDTNTPSKVNAVIDLNGHTITNNADAYLFLIMDNAKVTFTDSSAENTGKVIGKTNAPIIWATGTETVVTIKDGYYKTVNSEGLMWATHSGDLVIEGGEFKTTAADASRLIMRNAHDRQNSQYFISGKSAVTVTGGIFHGFNPEKMLDDSTTPFTEFNGCAEGYVAKEENGIYTVAVKTDVTIGSVEELIAFGNAVTGNTEYQDVKVAANPDVVVTLTADLNLEGSGFAPIGNGAANAFSGTFDGGNHTISNMTLVCNYYRGVGFFRSLGKGAVVKNLTFVNADVNNGAATAANHFYGVVAGFSNNLTLDNVDIKDSSVTCKYAGAAYVGCLEGATTIKNCDAENVTVNTTSIRTAVYGILGNSANGHTATLENNTITNVVSTVDSEIKAIKETLEYNEWADGTEYTESTYVAKIGEAKYSTLYDAVAAAKDGDTITLIGNVERVKYLTIDKSITLDLDGKSITRNGGTTLYVNGENITVTIEGKGTVESSTQALYVDNGTVKVENGKFKSTVDDGPAVYVINNGQVEIYGGEFSNKNGQFVLNEYDATRDVTSITVYGGTFYGFNPENNASEGAGTNFVAESCIVIEKEENVYEVVDYIKWIKAELLAGRDVKLERDITVDGSMIESIPAPTNSNGKYPNYGIFNIVGDYDVTFDLNGHTITYNGHEDFKWNGKTYNSCTVAHGLFFANAGADFTVIDSSAEKTGTVMVYGLASGAYVASNDTKFTIKGGTWKNKGCAVCGGTNIFLYPLQGGELYIEDGHFEQALDAAGESYLIVEHGGEYKNSVIDYAKTKVEISGGTFVGMNPSEIKYFQQTADNKLIMGEITDGCAEGFIGYETGEENVWGVEEAVAARYDSENNYIKPYDSLEDALHEAEAGDTVKLCKAIDAFNVVVPEGVTLDIQSNTLTVDYLVVVNGAYLTGETVSATKEAYGKVFVEHAFISPSSAYVGSDGYSVLPILNGDHYVFSKFIVSTDGTIGGLTVNEDGSIKLNFKHMASGWLHNKLVENGTKDLGFSVVVRVDWVDTENTGKSHQVFDFSAEFVKSVARGNGNVAYQFTMKNYQGLEGMTISAYALTDSGMISVGKYYDESDFS